MVKFDHFRWFSDILVGYFELNEHIVVLGHFEQNQIFLKKLLKGLILAPFVTFYKDFAIFGHLNRAPFDGHTVCIM